MLQVGMKAPDFSVHDHDGNTVTLSDYAGKKVVIFFYPCLLYTSDAADE